MILPHPNSNVKVSPHVTYTLSQRELQRVAVLAACIRGDLACVKAAELMVVSRGHLKRLKRRYHQGGKAALAHASRGRRSSRRLPERSRARVRELARTRYAGFNDNSLTEKLTEVEGLRLSRETVRRLLRRAGMCSPRKRRPPTHRQRQLRLAREGDLAQLDGSPHDWLEGRGPRPTALGLQDYATGSILAAQFFLSETMEGYFHLPQSLLRRFGVPLASCEERSAIFARRL